MLLSDRRAVDREGLGDALLKLPFLRAISRAYPDRPIWWIATHTTSMAREMKPFVSDMISHVVENARITTPMGTVIRQLRTFPPFDLVFDMRTRLGTVFLARTVLKHRGFFCCLPGYALSDKRPPGRWSRPEGIAARALSMAEAALQRPPDWHGRFQLSERIRARGRAGAAGRPEACRHRHRQPRGAQELAAGELCGAGGTARSPGLGPGVLHGPQERAIADGLRARSRPPCFRRPMRRMPTRRRLNMPSRGRAPECCVANDSGMGICSARSASRWSACSGRPIRAMGAPDRAWGRYPRAGPWRRVDGGDSGRSGSRRGRALYCVTFGGGGSASTER